MGGQGCLDLTFSHLRLFFILWNNWCAAWEHNVYPRTKNEAGEQGTSQAPFNATSFLEMLTLIPGARWLAVLPTYLGSLLLHSSYLVKSLCLSLSAWKITHPDSWLFRWVFASQLTIKMNLLSFLLGNICILAKATMTRLQRWVVVGTPNKGGDCRAHTEQCSGTWTGPHGLPCWSP